MDNKTINDFSEYCFTGNIIEVVKMLRAGNIDDIDYNHGYFSVLAASGGNLDILKQLVLFGANVHINKEAPLWMATHRGRIDIIKYLVDRGADIQLMLSNCDPAGLSEIFKERYLSRD